MYVPPTPVIFSAPPPVPMKLREGITPYVPSPITYEEAPRERERPSPFPFVDEFFNRYATDRLWNTLIAMGGFCGLAVAAVVSGPPSWVWVLFTLAGAGFGHILIPVAYAAAYVVLYGVLIAALLSALIVLLMLFNKAFGNP